MPRASTPGRPARPPSAAELPLAEAGEGESEGYEQAEAELEENAELRDSAPSDAERQIDDAIEAASQPSTGETPEPLASEDVGPASEAVDAEPAQGTFLPPEPPRAAEAPADGPAAEAPADEPTAETHADEPVAETPAEPAAAEAPATEAPADEPTAETPAEPAAEAPADEPTAETPAEPAADAAPADGSSDDDADDWRTWSGRSVSP